MRPFAYFGQISYGLYLFHPNCLGWSAKYLAHNTLTNALMGLVVTMGVAMISWHLFERPINDLKNRFVYGKNRRISRRAHDAQVRESLALPEIQ
jgi:peptidoglycan/LPS O-acetylase OafA/YrhL